MPTEKLEDVAGTGGGKGKGKGKGAPEPAKKPKTTVSRKATDEERDSGGEEMVEDWKWMGEGMPEEGNSAGAEDDDDGTSSLLLLVIDSCSAHEDELML